MQRLLSFLPIVLVGGLLVGASPSRAQSPEPTDPSQMNPAIYIFGTSAAQNSYGQPNFVPPKFVQIQVNQQQNNLAQGQIILIDSLTTNTGTVPVLSVSQVTTVDNDQTQFVVTDDMGNPGQCIFWKSKRDLSCDLGPAGTHDVVLEPNATMIIQPIAAQGQGASASHNTGIIFQDYNNALQPEWNTIARDMECRKFPNIACHDNAYPTVDQWNQFIAKFNLLIEDVNRVNDPQLTQDVQAAADSIGLIPLNPANANQMKISRQDYSTLKDAINQIKQDLQHVSSQGQYL